MRKGHCFFFGDFLIAQLQLYDKVNPIFLLHNLKELFLGFKIENIYCVYVFIRENLNITQKTFYE